MRSFSWSHHGESRSIKTQWRSCALNGCSHSLNGVHAHSMVFRGCSYSLIGIYVHSMGVQGLFTITQRRPCALSSVHSVQYSLKGIQPVQILEGPMNTFSNIWSALRPYIIALNFCWMLSNISFLWHGQTRGVIKGGLGVCQWNWQQNIRKYCENLEN